MKKGANEARVTDLLDVYFEKDVIEVEDKIEFSHLTPRHSSCEELIKLDSKKLWQFYKQAMLSHIKLICLCVCK